MSEAELPSFEIEALHNLLEQEFDFLTNQDFESFEKLQSRKQELLNFLINELPSDSSKIPEITEQTIIDNKEISDRLAECQNLQKRNELLINQKLSSIQEVLSTLGYQNLLTNKDTYEHLNKKKR
ncbi:MAG: hypothetical protein P8N40_10535 [Gammaproteobacteria bacterium]|nr:hypothetical protein [Gammaproteobacteria bacterium]